MNNFNNNLFSNDESINENSSSSLSIGVASNEEVKLFVGANQNFKKGQEEPH
jgi:hypothetical protein